MWPPATAARWAIKKPPSIPRIPRGRKKNTSPTGRLPNQHDLKNPANFFISVQNNNTNTKNGDVAESPTGPIEGL